MKISPFFSGARVLEHRVYWQGYDYFNINIDFNVLLHKNSYLNLRAPKIFCMQIVSKVSFFYSADLRTRFSKKKVLLYSLVT
jgi:hypothetical protein